MEHAEMHRFRSCPLITTGGAWAQVPIHCWTITTTSEIVAVTSIENRATKHEYPKN